MSACSRMRSSTAGTGAAIVALVVVVTMTGACSGGARVTLAASTTTSSTTVTLATTTTVSPTTTLAPAPTTVAIPATTRAVVAPSTTAAVRTTSAVTTKTAAPLFGAAIGSEAEGAVAKLIAALGPPTSDTGWDIGCALDSPTLKNERLVGWDQLRVLFGRDTEAAPGTLRGYGFVLLGDEPLPANSAVGRLALPSGAALGTPIGQVAIALGVKAQVDKVFGWVSVTTTGATFTADGDSLSALLNAVSVPRVFSCE